MITISDSRPDEDDVVNFTTQLKNRRGGASDVLSKKEATSLRKKQDNLINNYTYTTEDIQKSIQVSKNMKKTISNIGAEKTRVNIAVQAARSKLDDERKKKADLETNLMEVEGEEENQINTELGYVNKNIEEYEKDLEEKIEEQKKVLFAENSRIKQLKKNKKNTDWAAVNARAIAANKAADMEAYKNELEERKSGKKEAANPYARRKVKPRNLWNVGQEDSKDPANGDENKNNDSVNDTVIQDNIDESGDANQSSRDLRIDLKKKLSEHINDMSIDEEAIPRLMMPNAKKIVTSRVRKGISITDYFDLKAKAIGSL